MKPGREARNNTEKLNKNILARTRKWALESFPLETEKPSRESF
jgi:hypothetical protein